MILLHTSSGTPLEPVSFGTMQFGGGANESDAAAMFECCLEAGIRHFDTAHIYCEGRSESILGDLIQGHDDLYIATKVGYADGAGRDTILAQLEDSRRRLRGRIDLLYMHRFDPDTSLRETFETLATLQDDGVIRHIGVSNYAAWQVMKAQAIAAEFGTRIDVVQPMYNLVKRQAEVEILPMCADQGLAACTYSPLGGGLLTGKYGAGGQGRLTEDARYGVRYGQNRMHVAARELSAIAAREGVHPATLAVAWLMRGAHGAQPILSARTPQQLDPSLTGITHRLNAEMRAELDALIPAPPPATDRIEEV